MPRNVRNWWIRADIDGRSSALEGGPVSRDGGFSLVLSQRDGGEVADALTLEGHAYNGRLRLIIADGAGRELGRIVTHRDGPAVGPTGRRGWRVLDADREAPAAPELAAGDDALVAWAVERAEEAGAGSVRKLSGTDLARLAILAAAAVGRRWDDALRDSQARAEGGA